MVGITRSKVISCLFDRWMSRFIFKILSRNGSLVESPTADTSGTNARVRELIQKHLQDAPMQFLRPILVNQKDWKPWTGSHGKKTRVFFWGRCWVYSMEGNIWRFWVICWAIFLLYFWRKKLDLAFGSDYLRYLTRKLFLSIKNSQPTRKTGCPPRSKVPWLAVPSFKTGGSSTKAGWVNCRKNCPWK